MPCRAHEVKKPCELALRAVGAARGHPGGGASCLGVGRPRLGVLPRPTARPWGVRPGPATHRLWVRGGGGRGDPSPTPQRALLRAGLARCGGGTRAPGRGASCLGVGRPGLGALPRPPVRPSGMRPGPATHWLWVRSAGAGARLSMAPSPMPLFVLCCARFPGLRRPVAVVAWHLSVCLRCGWRRASLACLVAPRRCAVVPFPTPGAVDPGFTGRLRGARGGRSRTGLFVPAAGPRRGRGAGLAPRLTRSGRRDAVVPGRSLRFRSWAACAAVVWRVLPGH